jgi:predicted DNA-binding protein
MARMLMSITMPPATREHLEVLAEQENKSMCALIVDLIEKAYTEQTK